MILCNDKPTSTGHTRDDKTRHSPCLLETLIVEARLISCPCTAASDLSQGSQGRIGWGSRTLHDCPMTSGLKS